MRDHLGLELWRAALGASLLVGWMVAAPGAAARPPCGQCADGSFDDDNLVCIAGEAMDCTECTVCAPKPPLPG